MEQQYLAALFLADTLDEPAKLTMAKGQKDSRLYARS